MTNFVKALEGKIKTLQEERVEHEEAIESIDAKLELLNELYAEESGEPAPTTSKTPKKRRPGRPKGSTKKLAPTQGKHAVNDELYQEALKQASATEGGGTSPELQERMLNKKFNPQPRPTRSLGAGITAGTKKQVDEARGHAPKSNATVSVDESDLGDD